MKARCSIARNFLDAEVKIPRCADRLGGVENVYVVGGGFGATPFGDGAPVQ